MQSMMRLLSIIALLMVLQSCANYKLQYASEVADWEAKSILPVEAPVHTVYLIGDAGGGRGPALALLEQHLKDATKESTVVFLGDNIYPNGLGPKKAGDRAEDEIRLKAQLDILKGYEGNVYFIAGNHDWYKYGIDGVDRQKDFIEDYLDRKGVLMPKPGCGEPKEIDLSDDLVLILIDSQWYLTDWDKEYKINAGCEVKSRAVFQEYVENAIKGNRSKNIIIAMHHPPYTNGPHGGNFTLKQHLFPLTDINKNLYLPLPLLGTGLQFLRGTIGHKQDAMHPKYRELADIVISSARKNGNFVIASGHEHSLQYMENDEQYFVVSGAGSKQSPSRLGNNADFVYGHQGFAQLNYYKDGSCWIQYWAGYENGEGKLVYRKKMKGALPDIVEEVAEEFPSIKDSVTIPVSRESFDKGKLWNLLWGEHYRDAYKAEISVPSLDMAAFNGGVEPVKRGGGYQTNSLRLEAKSGKQYTMRSIDKDASRTVGYPFDQSIVTQVVKDNFSAAHPMAAMVVAALAKEAGVYHTSPELYYVPPQKALGIYNDDFADALYLVEERPDDDLWQEATKFGKPDEIMSTLDMTEKVLSEHDEVVDYRHVVRSRLFDVLVGDWDRHDDQWRWGEHKNKDIDYYQPIPRDRDQAFCKYDGFILGLAKGTSPDVKKLLVYDEKVKNIRWLLYNGRHFDRTFLAGASWSVWEEETKALQKAITDELIEAAFKNEWPQSLYDIDAPKLMETLKTRRDNMMEIARTFYSFMAKRVDAVGTYKKDHFLVERLTGGKTRIRIYDAKEMDEGVAPFYDRTFLPKETKEVILYGLKGDDVFEVKGDASGQTIKLRMIGGLGEDELRDESNGRGLILYDAIEEKTLVTANSKAKLKFKKDILYNTYNRESKDYDVNYMSLLPSLSFNPDDEFLVGLAGSYTTYGFKKEPFASQHKFGAFYAFETGGMSFRYSNEFIDVIGNWELGIDAHFQTPLYAINFYGLGNDTTNPEVGVEDDDNIEDYNRVRQRVVEIYPAISRRLNARSTLKIGPTIESIRVERTAGRFIDDIGDGFDPELFDGYEFVGARLLLDFKNSDHNSAPTRGVGLFLDSGWKQNLDVPQNDFAYLDAMITLYQHLDRSRKLVFASRLGFQHRFSEAYEFYQGATLGGPGPDANFRGFRRNRFTGTTAFWQNTDIRWKMMTSDNPTIPFSFGILGGFDHGRVWFQEDSGNDSDTWHYSYGGGIWMSPFDLLTFNISFFRGDNEENTFLFGGGFFF
jgi:hypothetical protein